MEWMINKNSNAEGKKFQSWMDFVSGFFIYLIFRIPYVHVMCIQNPETDNIIRLRGMPFEAGAPEIVQFFEGM